MNASSNLRFRTLAAVAPPLILLMMACSSGLEPQEAVLVGIASDINISVGAESHWASGEFRLTLENQGPQSVRVNNCGVFIERLEGSTWTLVWEEVCPLEDGQLMRLTPGMSSSRLVVVDAELGRYPAERWQLPIEGRYRATVIVFGVGDSSRTVSTGSFVLE